MTKRRIIALNFSIKEREVTEINLILQAAAWENVNCKRKRKNIQQDHFDLKVENMDHVIWYLLIFVNGNHHHHFVKQIAVRCFFINLTRWDMDHVTWLLTNHNSAAPTYYFNSRSGSCEVFLAPCDDSSCDSGTCNRFSSLANCEFYCGRN